MLALNSRLSAADKTRKERTQTSCVQEVDRDRTSTKMSSSLKLYHAIGSPASRACLLLIKTMQLDAEVKFVDLNAGEQNSPEFLKLNPLHQVPVLVDGDLVLTESRAILAYLVNKYKPGSDLYPSKPELRALVDQRLYYDATVVFESCAHIIVRASIFQ